MSFFFQSGWLEHLQKAFYLDPFMARTRQNHGKKHGFWQIFPLDAMRPEV